MDEVRLASVYAPAGAPRRDAARAEAYARWTLRGEGPRAQDAAFAVADKVLRRGALVPAPEALEPALARLLGPRLQAGLRAAAQLQQAALRYGAWTAAATDLADAGPFTRAEASALLRLSLDDFRALWASLRALYPGEDAEAGPLFISFTGAGKAGWDVLEVVEGWDGGDGPAPLAAAEPGGCRPSEAALRALLRRAFGHADFRPGQREAVAAVLEGRDAAALLPTAGGKSLIAHLAALLRPGAAVIVEPLLAVVDDQRRALARRGVAAGAAGERADLEAFAAGRLPLLYASPERLESGAFRRALRGAAETCGVALVAVDEAHCVTDWGDDFRPALGALGRRARRWAAGPAGTPPLLALTGTATEEALSRACAVLELRAPAVTARPLSRAELRFSVERCGRGEHLERLRAWLRREPGARFGPGLAFCRTVEQAAAALDALAAERLCAALYTGRAPAREDAASWPARKAESARAFLGGRADWLCCTSAFALGVDVPGARFTAHLGLPSSAPALLQEAGRAGRDGRPALCRLFLHVDDERRARRWLDPGASWDAVAAEHAALAPRRRDDVWASLSLHRRSWPGLSAELRDLRLVGAALGPLRMGALLRPRLPGQAAAPVLRALARFESAGLLEVWARGPRLAVLARADALPAQALEAAAVESRRAYALVEPARRAALGALLEGCLAGRPGG